MDVVAHVIKYNGMSAGRDKLCRLFQYASKYAGWYAQQHQNKDFIDKFKSLENSLSASRKVLRLGKSVDMIQGAIRSLDIHDPVIRLVLVISKLNQALYLLVDHYVWAAKIGLATANAKDLSKIASKFWLASITCNIIRNIHDIRNILNQHTKRRKDNGDSKAGVESGIQALLANRPLVIDVVKNFSDLILPLTNLGFVDTPVPVQAILGVIGSLMGILVVWNPVYKLKP